MARQPEIVKQSELLNQLVLDRVSLEELGRIEVLWTYPQAHRVFGFICKPKGISARRLAFKLVQMDVWGDNGILTHSPPEPTTVEKVRQLESLVGHEVWSEAGDRIGKIIDYLFDLQTGAVTAYLLVPLGLGAIAGDVYQISPEQILSFGNHRVLVSETSIDYLQIYREGIQQKLTKAQSQFKAEATKEWQSLTQQAQTAREQARERLQSLAERAREQMQQWNEQLREQADVLKDRSQDWAEDVQTRTRDLSRQMEEGFETLTVQAEEIFDRDAAESDRAKRSPAETTDPDFDFDDWEDWEESAQPAAPASFQSAAVPPASSTAAPPLEHPLDLNKIDTNKIDAAPVPPPAADLNLDRDEWEDWDLWDDEPPAPAQPISPQDVAPAKPEPPIDSVSDQDLDQDLEQDFAQDFDEFSDQVPNQVSDQVPLQQPPGRQPPVDRSPLPRSPQPPLPNDEDDDPWI